MVVETHAFVIAPDIELVYFELDLVQDDTRAQQAMMVILTWINSNNVPMLSCLESRDCNACNH